MIQKGDVLAILYGTLVTAVLSCTMVVAGLKAGITPGVSPLVVLCGWGAFRKASQGAGGARFLNLAQVAGSSGMAIVSGMIFSEPLLQVLHLNLAQTTLEENGETADLAKMPWKDAKALMAQYSITIPEVSISTNILACLAGSFIGYGFVGLATKKFLSDPSLPAPEARACMSMINAAASDAGRRPRLCISLVLSVLWSLCMRVLALISLMVKSIMLVETESHKRSFSLEIPIDNGPLYMGIGGLLTLPTALLTFAGAFTRLIGDYLLTRVDASGPMAEDFPSNSMRWVGGGAMTMGVLYSLVRFMGAGECFAREASEKPANDPLLEISPRLRTHLIVSVAAGLLALAVWLFGTAGFSGFSVLMLVALLIMAMMMVPLGALLSLQIGSSCSPVSGTVFVTILVLCSVALLTGHASLGEVPTITTVLVGGCVAVCAANDVSQDYKTLQLCGVAPREGFLSQITGLLVGSVIVPVSLYISAAAFGLGTASLPSPQGQMFATLVDGLLIEADLPWYPILIGLSIGAVAVGVDVFGSRIGVPLPAMAFAVGIYLSPDSGTGILIGSLFRYAGEWQRVRRAGGELEQTHECILAAAGMITGSASLDLVLGVAVLFNLDIESLSLFTSDGEAGKASIPAALTNLIASLGVLFLGWILYHNSLNGSVDGDSSGEVGKSLGEDKANAQQVTNPQEADTLAGVSSGPEFAAQVTVA